MVLASHLNPVTSEIVLKQTEYAQRVVLVDIVGLELIQDDKDEQLHENFLTQKDIHQPEEQVVPMCTLCPIIADNVPLPNSLEHVKVPVLARSYDE